jgi:glycerophosphoryl diester phosphodiesterase
MSVPELIAHRGYRALYPENSLRGIEAAMAAGARYVEVDVHLSADRIPVLIHDPELTRICGVPGQVHDLGFSDLLALNAAERGRLGGQFDDNRLASLGQLVELIGAWPDVTVFVEIKTAALERFGVETVLDVVAPVMAPVAGRCVLISFSVAILAESRRRMSDGISCGCTALGGVVQRWQERYAMAGLGLEYLFCDVQGLPTSGGLSFESARLAIYEVNDPALATELAARGVSLIETFDLPGLQELLAG